MNNKSFIVFRLFIVVGVLGFGENVKAQTRIFYEDCEDTSFTEWFLERSYGTNYSTYWAELTSELTRSNESPHSGSYCMTYDPWVTGNPHTNIGVLTTYGNTSNFDISITDVLNDFEINIYNINGQKVFHEMIKGNNSEVSKKLDVSGYPKGIYIVEVRSEELMKTEKLLLE